MANVKITDLTAYTDAASTDVLAIVDVSNNVTKKISISDLLKATPLGTAALPAIAIDGDPNTGIYSPGADQLAFSTGGTGRLFIDSSGRVGIGTSSPSSTLTVSSSAAANTFPLHLENPTAFGWGVGLKFRQPLSSGGAVIDSGAVVSDWDSTNGGTLEFYTTSGAVLTERLRIDSSGRLLVGTSTSRSTAGISGQIQLEGTTYNNSSINLVNNGNDVQPSYLVFAKQRSGSVGGNTIVQSGDYLGYIAFAGGDGTDLATEAATIAAYVDGTPGANDMPGRLVFSTTADGASSPTERLRIDSSGRVGIGTSSPGTSRAYIQCDDTNTAGLTINGTNSSGGVSSYSSLKITGGTPNAVGTHYGVEFVKTASNVEGITGYFANITGSYNTQTNFHAKLTKDLNAYTNGYCYYADLSTSGSGGAAYFAYFYNSASSAERFSITSAGTTKLTSAASTAPFVAQIGSSEVARIDSSGRLLVGTSSVAATGSVFIQGNSGGSTGAGYLNLQRGQAAGASIVAGTLLGLIQFTDSSSNIFAQIYAEGDATSGTNDYPGRLVFSTTADGASSPTERMRISQNGQITTEHPDASTVSMFIKSTSASFAATALNIRAVRNTSNSTYNFFQCTRDGVADVLFIRDSGNVENTNNSYGAISDIKLKENIVDANSQWGDIKALQVRNYNFKEGQTHTQIGLIAQEVELVSPGLVSESPDRDAEGNDLGTVTKSVNYSVLYMKAVKALQEAMERIETLEAKVAALEGA